MFLRLFRIINLNSYSFKLKGKQNKIVKSLLKTRNVRMKTSFRIKIMLFHLNLVQETKNINHQNRVNFPRCKTKEGKLLWMWSGIANIHTQKIHSSKKDGVNVKTRMNHTSYTHSSTCAIFIPINWNNSYADRCLFFF